MPTSNPQALTWLVQRMARLRPQSMLDVGVGAGKWGMLYRDYVGTKNWPTARTFRTGRIDGVEPFEPYIEDMHRVVYDNIYIGTIEDLIDGLGYYEMIMAVAVLEHIAKDTAIELLPKLLDHCRHLLIMVPIEPMPQGAWGGNEYERHVSTWRRKDFDPFAVVDETSYRTSRLMWMGQLRGQHGI